MSTLYHKINMYANTHPTGGDANLKRYFFDFSYFEFYSKNSIFQVKIIKNTDVTLHHFAPTNVFVFLCHRHTVRVQSPKTQTNDSYVLYVPVRA